MIRSMLKVAGATLAYGLLHSALASRPAKEQATRLLGERQRNGFYRVFFISQSVVSFAALAAYIRKQPSRQLYCVQGPPAWLMHCGQLGGAVFATLAAHHVGIPRILGWTSLFSWLYQDEVQPEPEAQGPALDQEGSQQMTGPFAVSRHPLNLAPIPILWLWPRMTTNLLAFNTVATAYLIIGSLHEEVRLRQAYGERYESYQQSGVPFFMPSLRTLLQQVLLQVVSSQKGIGSPMEPRSPYNQWNQPIGTLIAPADQAAPVKPVSVH